MKDIPTHTLLTTGGFNCERKRDLLRQLEEINSQLVAVNKETAELTLEMRSRGYTIGFDPK